jgi:hypothetical protein
LVIVVIERLAEAASGTVEPGHGTDTGVLAGAGVFLELG